HPMQLHPGAGLWDIFLPDVATGALYKYEIKTRDGGIQLKADPYAFAAERPPRTASIVHGLQRRPDTRRSGPAADRQAPVCIYEVHLGSWRRVPDLPRACRHAHSLCQGDGIHTYRTHARERVPLRWFLGLSADRTLR